MKTDLTKFDDPWKELIKFYDFTWCSWDISDKNRDGLISKSVSSTIYSESVSAYQGIFSSLHSFAISLNIFTLAFNGDSVSYTKSERSSDSGRNARLSSDQVDLGGSKRFWDTVRCDSECFGWKCSSFGSEFVDALIGASHCEGKSSDSCIFSDNVVIIFDNDLQSVWLIKRGCRVG